MIQLQTIIFTILTVILSLNFSSAQNELTKEAWRLYESGSYKASAEKYMEALEENKLGSYALNAKYNAACAWALSGEKEKAVELLYQLAKKDYYTDFGHISRDADFKSLHTDKRWEEIKKIIKGNKQKIEELIPFYERRVRQQHFDSDEFAKEHIPLDGNKVKMIPYRVSKRFGFVSNDSKYKWLIKPQFEQVFAVYKEGAIVLDTLKRYGMVRPDGSVLIPFEYFQIIKEGDLYCAKTIRDDSKSPEGIPTISPDDYERSSYCLLYDYYNKMENGSSLKNCMIANLLSGTII